MFFWNKICGAGIIFFLFGFSCYGQSSVKYRLNPHISVAKDYTTATDTTASFLQNLIFNKNSLAAKGAIIPASFSTCDYGFFCRQEIRVEKKIKIPLRVRLGSLQQANYYEGKR